MLLHELKDIKEGFVKHATAAALVGMALSGTYGYNKLLRDQDADDAEVSQEQSAGHSQQSNRSKARLLALAKRTKAKRMGAKDSRTENMPQSGSRPSDADISSSDSTTHGSRYQASQSSVND